jgi:hypothetical protein
MPKSEEDILVEILIQRKHLQDRLSWTVPCYSLLAESFILVVALSSFSNVSRIISSGLGMIIAVMTILSCDRLKNGELFDTSILDKIVTKISNDEEVRSSSLKEHIPPAHQTTTEVQDGMAKITFRSQDTTTDIPVDFTLHRAVLGDKYHAKRTAYYINREFSGFRTLFADFSGNIGWMTLNTFFFMAFAIVLVLSCIQEHDDDKHYL